ncbi:uncharacterized protein BP01DRAFT_419281 [Aspergillus saccharolyticus JOP 1030-1]|uniref:DER1-domain-containing protein n=1 Tax=Aspergillus saccharolyticus JOP 1030-1 TaxID=1450539 RepID=A0A318Z187_9EURO|nr:hypothetical protein BP01DRAFT_419281 [Aspergillus saccharolyticus JOP 1030-1]PYH40669.1 hypothetical protein BP01DRAFT_419281 [Aspergillus saccharolyticus JOP 1030-1]
MLGSALLSTRRLLLRCGQRRSPAATCRQYSSLSERLHQKLTAQSLPLTFDYIYPQQSFLLDRTLTDILPQLSGVSTDLPSITNPSRLPPGHHLVYFPPQVSLSRILPDGTDCLHFPGYPFTRRLWAGGSVRFPATRDLLLDGRRAVCIETIRDVLATGPAGKEKVTVKVERRIGTVREGEHHSQIRARIWKDEEADLGHSSVIEHRNLVFMRDKTPEQLTGDRANFRRPSRTIKCAPGIWNCANTIREVDYKNLAPLFVGEELTICGKPKAGSSQAWDVWIEDKDGGLAFWSLPPVIRTLSALTFAQSALMYGGLLNGYYLLFDSRFVSKFPPEVWRLLTPFMITRPGLSLFLDVYLMYTYGSSLETGSPRLSGPGNFFVYTVFVASIIMLTAGCLLGCVTFTSALILAFVYTFAQENRGRKAMFFVVQLPVEFLPWAMLAFTLVANGWPAVLGDGTGIVAAHLYEFLTRIYPAFGGGQYYLVTPTFVRNFFTASTPHGNHRAYGTAFQPPNQAPASASEGWTSVFQGPRNRRGPGRRLGGN